MTIRKLELSVGGLAVALLVAVGMLSFDGVSYAYGIESQQEEITQIPLSEDQTAVSASSEKCVVSFADWYPSVEIEQGQSVPEPDPLTDRVITYMGKERPVVFKGWVASWNIEPDVDQRLYCVQYETGGVMNALYDFSRPITYPNIELYPVFYCPSYRFSIGMTTPDGTSSGITNHVLANDTVGSLTISNPEYYRYLFQTLNGASSEPVEPGTEPSFLPGYTFVGWFDQYGTRFELDTPILRDTEIEPKFERNGNPIPPDTEDIPVQGDTGVIASGALQGESIPEGAKVWVSASAVNAGDAYDALTAQMGNGVSAGLFEVNLIVNGQQVHEGFGSLTFTFPVDAKYNGHWVTVWHRHHDGSITSERVIAENGAVAVSVTDLSTFALEVEEFAASEVEDGQGEEVSQVGEVTSLAKTGDPLSWAGFAGLALAALAACVAAALSSRKVR